MFEVEFHPTASAELDEIYAYIAFVENEPLNAIRFVHKVDRQARELLSAFPNGHPAVLQPPPRHVRYFVIRPYLIYFEVRQEQGRARVLAIWHARRSDRPILRDRQAD